MRRVAWLGGLLLPLMLRGIPAEAPATPSHAWPLSVAAEPAPARRDFVASPSTGKFTDRAVQTLKPSLARPTAPRRNLVQVDLSRRVRLAILSTPQWVQGVSGRHLVCVPVLSLQW